MRYVGLLKYFTAMLAIIVSLGFLAQQNIFADKCPCDFYKDGGTPCVGAHSTVRALYGSYNGPLYQVRRKSDNKTLDIGVTAPGGFANAAAVDSFLKGTTGTVSVIYDQSEKKNDLTVSQGGSAKTDPDSETSATTGKITISGHTVYGLATEIGEGYRNNHTNGVATGNQAEGMYFVVSGKRYNSGCCWDYGNAESDASATGKRTGAMESLYFGSSCWFKPCVGNGPWVLADLEWGLFQAGPNGVSSTNISLPYQYVSGFLKGDMRTYTIRANDATQDTLKLMGSTDRPAPNQLTGAIILGTGGDNAPSGYGTFYEGAITIGRPPDSAENAIQKNLSAVYGNKVATFWHSTDNTLPSSSFKVRYNEATGSAVISYVLSEAGRVRLNVFNQLGRHIAGIVNHVLPAGRHEAVWAANRFPPGVYIWRIAVDGRDEGAGKIIVGK